jgi:cell division septal protein FtsQ
VAAPADKRFRRAHVKPMRRRKWRAAVAQALKYGGLALVAVFALYRGSAVVSRARVLQIDHIVVHGNGRLSSGEVLAVLDGLRGQNLMRTNLDAWRNRLLASPWVKDASLRRSLPSTIDVTVLERNPIAIGRMRDGLYLIDDRGLVIDQYGPQYGDLDLPIVDGLVSPQSEDGAADDGRADLAARLLSAVGSKPELAKRVSQVDVSDLHNAAVILSGDPAVIYVGDDRFLPRLESYEDLRFDDRIYVRPASAKSPAGKTANRG